LESVKKSSSNSTHNVSGFIENIYSSNNSCKSDFNNIPLLGSYFSLLSQIEKGTI
jgi:hypothetical protein